VHHIRVGLHVLHSLQDTQQTTAGSSNADGGMLVVFESS
jgi:hypothetical protein